MSEMVRFFTCRSLIAFTVIPMCLQVWKKFRKPLKISLDTLNADLTTLPKFFAQSPKMMKKNNSFQNLFYPQNGGLNA